MAPPHLNTYQKVNDPLLDRNLGKYQLPHIWDNILQDMPVFQVKQTNPPPPLLALPLPRFPNCPLTPPPIQGGGHMYTFWVSIQMGVPKQPPTSLQPFLCFPPLFQSIPRCTIVDVQRSRSNNPSLLIICKVKFLCWYISKFLD